MTRSSDIGKRTAEFEWQLQALQLTRDLLGGTDAMRAAGKKYLPMRDAETPESYGRRLSGAVLLNQYDRTGGYLCGQVFQKPIKYQEPQEGEKREAEEQAFWDTFAENVDAQGTNLSMFANAFFRAGVDDGVVFLLVDYSAVEVVAGEDGGLYYKGQGGELLPKNAEADAKNNWRPYFVLVRADQVLDCRTEMTNGVREVAYFRYYEQASRLISGEWKSVDRVREFTVDGWRLWERIDGASEYAPVNAGRLTTEQGAQLGRVPVTWYIPGKAESTGYTAQPAMKDLAWMNVAHFEANADHRELLRWVRSPVWFGNHLVNDEGKSLPFGPGRILNSNREGADLRSVGVDPASVEKSFQDMKKMEDDMALYGLQMLASTAQSMTATQADIAEAASNSQLKEWVQKLADTMENALAIVAEWKGYTDGPAIWVNSEFRIAYNANVITQLAMMVNSGHLSKQTLLETLKLMGVFADEFKVNDELERIKKDQSASQSYNPLLFGQSAEEGENLQQ